MRAGVSNPAPGRPHSPRTRSARLSDLYSEDDIARLELIKRMKPLGFSMSEMRDLLTARDDLASEGAGTDAAFKRLSAFAAQAHTKIEALRAQVETAEEFAQQLDKERRRHGQRKGGTSRPTRARRSRA